MRQGCDGGNAQKKKDFRTTIVKKEMGKTGGGGRGRNPGSAGLKKKNRSAGSSGLRRRENLKF